MGKKQWITIAAGVILTVLIYSFGRTIPVKKPALPAAAGSEITIDSILYHQKEVLTASQLTYLQSIENKDASNNEGKIEKYHELAHFWKDSARRFEPYAWYEAEIARLENSEKNLTFAARLFLEDLKAEENPKLKKWKALEARDLFERSLKINPDNDSSTVGLGACYMFGGISAAPMEGILKVRSVVEKDSTNIYALMTLGEGSVLSGQFDKAIDRFTSVLKIQPNNLEAILLLGETYERSGNTKSAVSWYEKAAAMDINPALKNELQKRIKLISE